MPEPIESEGGQKRPHMVTGNDLATVGQMIIRKTLHSSSTESLPKAWLWSRERKVQVANIQIKEEKRTRLARGFGKQSAGIGEQTDFHKDWICRFKPQRYSELE